MTSTDHRSCQREYRLSQLKPVSPWGGHDMHQQMLESTDLAHRRQVTECLRSWESIRLMWRKWYETNSPSPEIPLAARP